MEKKTVGLIATIGTTLICACPSLFICLLGGMGLSGTPIESTINGQTSSQPMGTGLAIGLLCVSAIGLLTPVAVGFFTLRKKPEDTAAYTAPVDKGPLPPTS